MNEVVLGFEIAGMFLTAAYLLHLVFQAFGADGSQTAAVYRLRFEKRSLLNQQVRQREVFGSC